MFVRTQDDIAIVIEGTDGQYYLQAGAILLPGPYLSFFNALLSDSFYHNLFFDIRMQARGVSKTKRAFRSTQFTRPATYHNVCAFSSLILLYASPYTHLTCGR